MHRSATELDMPTPRMSNQSTRANRPSDVKKSPISGCSASASRWLAQSRTSDDVVSAVADDLVGDVLVSPLRDVLRARERHSG